jgi:hypothetical protein
LASKSQNGLYTALDATAALQLLLLCAVGVHGWEVALQIAGDWYETIGVVSDENPHCAILSEAQAPQSLTSEDDELNKRH